MKNMKNEIMKNMKKVKNVIMKTMKTEIMRSKEK